MPLKQASAYPRSRTLIHPGPVGPVRIHALQSPQGRHLRLSLQPGLSLYDALVKPLTEHRITSAAITLFGGYFSSVYYCTPAANPAGPSVAKYSAPVHVDRTHLISGTATLGRSAAGAPLIHCHATLRTADGTTKGGHILPESSFVDAEPITALVLSFDTFGLQQIHDEETTMPLFQPRLEQRQ